MTQTYISKVTVDLWKQEVTLEWRGPNAASQRRGPFHCAPGAGIKDVNCDDASTSLRGGTSCTPKGEFSVIRHERRFAKFPKAEWVTRFQSDPRGIALHYYPSVPQYPSSNGCVRIADWKAAKLIHDNTIARKSVVRVHGELRPKFKTYRRGSKGEDVRKIQRQLIARGQSIVADGDFGPRTEAAVRKFQRQSGLVSDGICGRRTYNSLFA